MRLLAFVLTLAACQPSTVAKDPGGGGDDSGGGGDDSGGGEDTSPQPQDLDGDGYMGCVDGENCDCDDLREEVNPGVADDVCNHRDDDCDGEVDEDPDLLWYTDADGDGYGASGGTPTEACPAEGENGIEGSASNDADCDDASAANFPGADEICDEADNDCNGETDEAEALWSAFYADLDGDGAGDAENFVYGCFLPDDGAENPYDCDDSDASEPVFADPGGSSRGTGTVDNPYRSLQSAIDVSNTCVVAYAGTYEEDIDFAGRSVAVLGLDGSGATKISGSGAAPVVTAIRGETIELNGLTLAGGLGYASTSTYYDGSGYLWTQNYYYGGGIYASSASIHLDDVVIEQSGFDGTHGCTMVSTSSYECNYAYGGGAWISSSTVSMVDVQVNDNAAYFGSALYLEYSDVEATRLAIVGNLTGYYTVYAIYGSLRADALLMDANPSDYDMSGYYAYGQTVGIRNGTFVGNDYGFMAEYATVGLDSTIVMGDQYGLYDPSGRTNWSLQYNNVYGSAYSNYYGLTDVTGSDGNLSTSSGFVSFTDDDDWTNDNLSLRSSSALVDAGNPATERDDADGTPNDIGAYGGPSGDW